MTFGQQDENEYSYIHLRDETGYFDREDLEELRSFIINHLLSLEEDLEWLAEIAIGTDNRINMAAYWKAIFVYNSDTTRDFIERVKAEIFINLSHYTYHNNFNLDELEKTVLNKVKIILLEQFKKTLAHEYGHHWTLSYLAVNYGIDYTRQRMPWKYYWLRKLNPLDHAHDYSKGWENCDQEIVAEDYRVLFAPHPHNQEHEIVRRRNGKFKNPGEPIKQYIKELAEFHLGIWDRLSRILNL